MTQEINAAIEARRAEPEDVLRHVEPGAEIVVASANGEPVRVIDALEDACASLEEVRLHQMLALRARPYIEGERANLRHVSWFLSPANREAFHRGDCDLVPNSFSDVPRLMRQSLSPRLAPFSAVDGR
jgi:acyl-CoA hydrolase